MPDDPQQYVEAVLAGDRRMLSKTITLVESSLSEHIQLSREILGRLAPHAGAAVRLGITGVPGVGKSTFIEHLGMSLVSSGRRVAVLAVDPSSSRTGGSILADKTRMENLSRVDGAYIRPSASGGTLGGVARKTRETMLVCEAAGFDVVIVETVGVGQSEVTVASMVDFFLVLMLAGAGDELQGIKRGVLELADALAINKADGENRRHALQAQEIYRSALHLLKPAWSGWSPPVLTCSGLTGEGLDIIWQTVLEHRRLLSEAGQLAQKRARQAGQWMWTLVEEGLRERFRRDPEVVRQLPTLQQEVGCGKMLPTVAAEQLLSLLDKADEI